MAHKKQTTPSHSSYASFSSDEAENLCTRAIECEIRGDLAKAHYIIDNAPRHLDSSPIFHRYRSIILFKCAVCFHAYNPGTKERLIQDALISARRATQLSTNNLNFSLFYARFLVDRSEDGEYFEEAKKECKRALGVPNPESFDLECFRVEDVEYYQEELRFVFGVLDSHISPAHRKKQLVINQWMSRVGKYLKSLTATDWKDLLRVKVENFIESCSFMKALTFAKANHTWKYWFCPRCEEKFGDYESQLQHVLKDHVGNLSEELKPLLPKEVNQDWVSKLVNVNWEPIDVDAAMDQFKADPDCEEWPFCDDVERGKLLRAIHACLTMLVKYKYLSLSNLEKVSSYAMKEVQVLASGSLLLKRRLNDQSMLCIQLLDSSQLQKILKFLKSLSQACKLGPYAEHGSPDNDDDDDALILDNPGNDKGKRAILDPRSSQQQKILDFLKSLSHGCKLAQCAEHGSPDDHLFLDNPEADERIRAILDPSSSYIDLEPKITGYNNAGTSCPNNNEIMCVLSWLDENQKFKKHFRACFQLREARKHHGDKIIQKLEKEIEDLHMICSEKCNLLISQVHLQYVERICKRELTTSFEIILKKRKEELAERAEKGDDLGLNVISDVFMAAEASKQSQKGDEATTKFDNVGDDDTKMSTLDNSCITAALQMLEESLNQQLAIVDTKIMKNLSATRKLKSNLALTSTFDYLTALSPLLKYSVQDGIVKTVEENAETKSEAVKEVSLADILRDAEKNMDKRKDKKRSSNFKKTKGG